MSNLTHEQIGIIARRRLNLPPDDVIRFQPLVSQALLSLAHQVARRDDCMELRTEVAVTVINGVITVSDDTVLLQTLDKTGVLILNGIEVKWLPRYDDLRSTLPKDIYYAALRNRKIHVKDITTGNLNAVNTTGTLDANYVPTLSELPAIFDEELLAEVVKLAQGRTESTAKPLEEDNVPALKIDTKE